MMAGVGGGVQLDLLSHLPDAVLVSILSLPTRRRGVPSSPPSGIAKSFPFSSSTSTLPCRATATWFKLPAQSSPPTPPRPSAPSASAGTSAAAAATTRNPPTMAASSTSSRAAACGS
ncbi:unnamed protein product [Urochloa humidicola]